MPALDVTDVLASPEFMTAFVVTRRTQTVGMSDGVAVEAVVAGFPQTQYGVVTPASGSRMVRTPEGESVIGDIQIVTKFRLTEGYDGVQADIVDWNGREYRVVNTNDYSEFGAGFIVATCVKRTMN